MFRNYKRRGRHMKIIATLSIVYIVSLTFSAVSFAQTKGWTVITMAQDTLRSCMIGALAHDSANLSCGGRDIQIPVDSLKLLIRQNESHFWSSVGYGTLCGAGLGAFIGGVSHTKSSGLIDGPGIAAFGGGILGAATGFVIGGIIGITFGGDDRYDLTKESTDEKVKILREARRESQ
jgi:hypothetical protein